MKRVKILTNTIVCLVMAAIIVTAVRCTGSAYAQESDRAARVSEAVTAQQYIFKAQSVLPMRGTVRQLTADYDLRVSADSVVSFLPYFGRAYSAPIDPTQGGIRFVSTDFNYKVTEKSGGWDVVIEPKDVRDVQQLTLSIYESGNASLSVNSTNRQPISFNGYIAARTKK